MKEELWDAIRGLKASSDYDDFIYRQTFGLTYQELLEEPVDVRMINLKILELLDVWGKMPKENTP